MSTRELPYARPSMTPPRIPSSPPGRDPPRLSRARPAARARPACARVPRSAVRALRAAARAWELTAPGAGRRPARVPVRARRPDGSSELDVDPENPLARPAPGGTSRCSSFRGYEPPSWLEAEPLGTAEAVVFPSRLLRATFRRFVWTHPDADERSPLLVAHDGPEYAEHSSLLTLLGRLPPLRAALLGRRSTATRPIRPPRCTRARSWRSSCPRSACAGTGSASARASARSRSSMRTAATPRASTRLFLQSGSFFRRRDRRRSPLPPLRADLPLRRQRARRTGSAADPGHDRLRHRRGEPRRRRDVAEALRRQGYDARFPASATGTTGSRGATPSTRTSPS